MHTDIQHSELRERADSRPGPLPKGCAKEEDEISVLDHFIVLAERKRTIFLVITGVRRERHRDLSSPAQVIYRDSHTSAAAATLIDGR